MTIDVAVVTDHAYAPWCATTIASCASTTPDLRVHVLHGDDLTDADREGLRHVARSRGANMDLRPVDDAALAVLPTKGRAYGDRISWARIGLAELLPALDRVIYLDADTYAIDSLEGLWATEMDGAPVAAVRNVTHPEMHGHLASLGLQTTDYFNAGVLLVDLDRWRGDGVAGALVGVVLDRDELAWFDQDALNVVFAGRWKALEPRWNAMNSLWSWPDLAEKAFGPAAVRAATAAPGILHFEGPGIAKPWHYLSDHPWRSAYRSTLAATPWAGTPEWDRTMTTRLIAHLPKRRRVHAFARLMRGRERLDRIRHRISR